MKNIKVLLILALGTSIWGCSTFPFEKTIKDGYFKFTNLHEGRGSNSQTVYLMCWKNRPTLWSEPKQYLAGEHDLWIKAVIHSRMDGMKEAYANFKTNLSGNKSYRLNKKIEDNKISIWIEDVASGSLASEVLVRDLKLPPVVEDNYLQINRCKEGSV